MGGYGRSTLGLNSDVDVVFLCDDSDDPFIGALAEGLLYPLWDLGVDIGHAVRSVDETLSLPWIAMELLSGQDLRERVRTQGPLSIALLSTLMKQLEEAGGSAELK